MGIEFARSGIAQQAITELPRRQSSVQRVNEIEAGYDELTGAYARFEHSSQVVAASGIVDHLHDWPQSGRRAIQHKSARLTHKVPPLPIGVRRGGKILERPMRRLAENAHRFVAIGEPGV